MARATLSSKPTRIQAAKTARIMEAALKVFSEHGFRGATLDQIADEAEVSKPNLLYYFTSKDDIHRQLLEKLLDTWLEPLRQLDPTGEPVKEITGYIRRKLEMSRDYPQESRLFANEILRGAPHVSETLAGQLRKLVDEKASIITDWAKSGKIAHVDARHLIFSIWAATQHYADFDSQVQAVLGPDADSRFEDATSFLVAFYTRGLTPEG